jgi:predicted RNA binding protein YcfA (HicA-like mRNA interferase family)
MTRLPRLTGDELIKTLTSAGFSDVRIRSHHYLRHTDGRATVVPVHAGETIGPGLLTKILRDCELTRSEFIALLSRLMSTAILQPQPASDWQRVVLETPRSKI